MIAFTHALLCTSLLRVTAQTREPELIAAAWVSACVGFKLYQHVSEPSQKRPSKGFIQRSVMPHQRQSKQDLLFKFPEKKCKYCISSVHMRTKPKNLYRNQKDPFVLWFRQIANYKWTCIFWLLTPCGLFHKTSLPNRPGLFQLVRLIVKWFGSIKQI